MITPVNNKLNFSLLTIALELMEQGKIKWLIDIGFNEEQLIKLKSIPYLQLLELSNTSVNFLSFKLNVPVFDLLLKTSSDNTRKTEMCDRAIMLGASNEILFKYFGLSTTEISTKRFLLNVHVTRGRSRKPNFEESEAIWKKWLELVKDNPLLNEVDDFNRLDAFMIITESISLFFSPNNQDVDSEQEYLSLTSIIKEIEKHLLLKK